MKKIFQWFWLMISVMLMCLPLAACGSSGESFASDGLDAVLQHIKENCNYTVEVNGGSDYLVNGDCIVYESISSKSVIYQTYVNLGEIDGEYRYASIDFYERKGAGRASISTSGGSFEGNTPDQFQQKFGYTSVLLLDWAYEQGKYTFSDSTLTIKGRKVVVNIGIETNRAEHVPSGEFTFSKFGATSYSLPSSLQQAIDSALGA